MSVLLDVTIQKNKREDLLKDSIKCSFLHKEGMAQRILSFAQHADRRSLTLVSKDWSKESHSFVQKIVDKVLSSNLTILVPLATSDFLDNTIRSLRTIAKTSTGEQLLHRISLKRGRIAIHQNRKESTCKVLSSGLIQVDFRDISNKRGFILEKSNGEFVFSSLCPASSLVHELIHALHHMENRSLSQCHYKKDAYFENAEEMLTISGAAFKDHDWMIDPINENAFRKECGLDPRMFHFAPVKSDLKSAAAFGVDGAFVDWIQKGSFGDKEAINYLVITVRTLLCGLYRTKRQFRNEKHLKIIKLLVDTGCDKAKVHHILRSEYEKDSSSEEIVNIVKQLSRFPLHDLIAYKWKKDQLKVFVNAFLKKEGIVQFISLLQTKNEEGLTPLQFAETMWKCAASETSVKEVLAAPISSLDNGDRTDTEAAFYKDIVAYFLELESALFLEPLFSV